MDQKQNIITTARRLFEQAGIKSVSMDDICHELGMSKKTLYQYFAQKDELVEAVLGDFSREMEEKIANFLQSDFSVWNVIDHYLEEAKSMPDVRKIPPFIYDLTKYYPTLACAQHSKVQARNREVVTYIIEKGIAEGVFRAELDIAMTSYLFVKMHDVAMEEGLRIENAELPTRRIIDFTFDVVIRGLFTPEGLKRWENSKRNI